MNRLANYLIIAAVGLIPLGITQQAHASRVYVRVDNDTDSHYSNAKSTGTVKICLDWAVTSTHGSQCASTKVLEVIAPDWDFAFDLPNGIGSSEVTQIRVTFDQPGDWNDLLVVDQFELLDGGFHRWRNWGVDNEKGFCFSHESADFTNSHCDPPNVLSPSQMLVLTP